MHLVTRLCQELQATGHDGQQVIEIMRYAAGDLADRLEFSQLEEFGLRLGARGGLGFDLGTQVRVQPFELGVRLVQRQRTLTRCSSASFAAIRASLAARSRGHGVRVPRLGTGDFGGREPGI